MALYNKINKDELKKKVFSSSKDRSTLSFYKYHQIDDPTGFRDVLYSALDSLDVLGRVYVSREGINAQISLPAQNLNAFRQLLKTPLFDFLDGIRLNVAIEDDGKSFFLLKIKVRHKIVADGLNDQEIDLKNTAKHLKAEEFNQMTNRSDVLIIDMRNHYESEVGHFRGAICPDVENFRDTLPIVEHIIEKEREKEVIMYCTGGIRCEKASAYFRGKGYENIYQLDGGIIEYARRAKQHNLENKFIGKNFVFDERLGERISNDIIARCHQCGEPCDHHINCANDACHILFIQCEKCAAKYDQCCSNRCKKFIKLSAKEQNKLKNTLTFNGTNAGKGRYRGPDLLD